MLYRLKLCPPLAGSDDVNMLRMRSERLATMVLKSLAKKEYRENLITPGMTL